MKNHIILFLLGFLTLASALQPNLVKSFFSIPLGNQFSNSFIGLKNGLLAYSLERNETAKTISPQFLNINLQGQNATRILQDTLRACGQVETPINQFGGQLYSRLYYHDDSSTLVYYCTANNSLLILDKDTYTVYRTISTGVTSTFNETKLYAEGNSVVVLGMGTLLSEQFVFPQLIKIDLIKNTVVRQVTFNKNLGAGENVVAYASTNLLSFILTTTIQGNHTHVNIYAVIFAGNFYTLTLLNSFNYEYNYPLLSDLQILGNYLVTNDCVNLYIFNLKGSLAYMYQNIQFTQIWTTSGLPFMVPNYAMKIGVSYLFVTLYNQGTFQLVQLNSQGQNITSDVVGPVIDSIIALGYQNTPDFALTHSQWFFSIINLQTSNVIYNVPYTFDSNSKFILTNSTYTIVSSAGILVYSLKTNLILTNQVLTANSPYFYEEVTRNFYIFNHSSATSCDLRYFNLETLASGVVQTFTDICSNAPALIVHVAPSNNASTPNLVLNYLNLTSQTNYFILFSEKNGVFRFQLPNLGPTIVPDYDDLSFYYVGQSESQPNFINVTKYDYNQTSNTFVNSGSYYRSNTAYIQGYLVIDQETVVIIYSDKFFLFGLSDDTALEYVTSLVQITSWSISKDNNGNPYIIISGLEAGFSNVVAYVVGPDRFLSLLPATDIFTKQAQGSGICSYSVLEGYVNSLNMVNFYNICPSDNLNSKVNTISQ